MKLLTIKEVVTTLRVSESTVRRLIRDGIIVAYKVGDRGQLRVKEQDLELYIETQRVQIKSRIISK
ncbi:Helix-turn-helix domain protein [anaerobic digester metagenome]